MARIESVKSWAKFIAKGWGHHSLYLGSNTGHLHASTLNKKFIYGDIVRIEPPTSSKSNGALSPSSVVPAETLTAMIGKTQL